MKRQYLLSVPYTNQTFRKLDAGKQIALLRSLGAGRVFLALEADSMRDGEKRRRELDDLKANCAVLHGAGFEVGAWFWAFFIGGGSPYAMMESPDGRTAVYSVCPTDKTYRAEMGRFVRDVAKTGVDLIQFDDDFRYGFQDMGFGCVCKNHRALIAKRLGRPVTKKELREKLLSGGEDPVRAAFVQANGEALEAFARDMRAALDKTAPDVRMGFCACITSWDLDGTSPDRLAKLLAGNTRPFYRLIGAPYWGAMRAWGHKLCDVIELERAEAARRLDDGIEMFSEGDTYPRPRFSTPASFLECFDTALRAAGCTDGILKYMIDYAAGPDYEPGYVDAHIKNMPTQKKIDRLFGNKTCVGVRVYDNPNKYLTYEVPDRAAGKTEIQDLTFSAASRFLTANSLPSVYEGAGVCGIAFGEDARALPDEAFEKGLILDAEAALILQSRGVDVGIAAAGDAVKSGAERFSEADVTVGHAGEPLARVLTLKPGAKALSVSAGEGFPLSYEYENAAGQRFLVFAFESLFASQGWMRCYLRAEQAISFAGRAGDGLPAVCTGNPELYILAKQADNRLAVGLWNLFPDPIEAPRVRLNAQAKRVRGVGTKTEANGNEVRLSALPAFGFAFFEAQI